MKIFLESTVKQFSCGGEKTKVFKSWLQQKFLDVLVKNVHLLLPIWKGCYPLTLHGSSFSSLCFHLQFPESQ